MSEWKEYFFEELFEIPLKNGLNKPSKVRGIGFRMVNMKEIFGYDFIGDDTPMELVPLEEREREFLMYGDLLFARQSLVASGAGKISYYRGLLPTVFESHLIRCRINVKLSNSLFIYYLIKSPIGRAKIETIIEQTAAAGIRGSDLKKLKFRIPDLPTQTAIAEILSSLDDKIELTNKINQELENLAQTLFKQWFIDFEFPNENGEPYISSGGEMVESELGKIPKGWVVGKFENLVKVNTGKGVNKKDYQINGNYPIIGANGIMGYYNNYNIDGFRILTGRVGTLGTVRISNGKAWTSDNVLFCEPIEYEYSHYAFFVMKGFNYNSLNRGSTQPLITQSDLKIQSIVIPNYNILKLFQNHMSLFLKMTDSNKSEIDELTILRDTLLPKLISGELEVSQSSNAS